MRVKKFDLWIADLNPGNGTEPGKKRPVLIVQSNFLNEIDHSSTLICPLTTSIVPGLHRLRVHLKEGISGLEKPSDILIDQMRSIDNRRLVEKIGSVAVEYHARINRNLLVVLDIEV